ncbi:MAG TPA: polyphosphate polymerase domain-containing protein [Pirellulaceae bacterium]|nr:polyphosphate polymerase domain-containing protein [Pirellulaceae bacterium]
MLAPEGSLARVAYHTAHAQHSPHQHAQSPSLRTTHDRTPAYEMKFLLSEAQAFAVEARLQSRLTLDPHAVGNGYHLTTLYCDTPRWEVFHRAGRFRLFKCRLRRYDQSSTIFLERKAKRREEVRKRRSTIAIDQLDRFAVAATDQPWEGGWYQQQLSRNNLRPTCLIEYDRVAYFGHSDEGPLRLTFDRHVVGGLTNAWSFETPATRHDLLPGQVVCEFKYRATLPSLFKATICDLQLLTRGVSKYRHCIQSTGAVCPLP